MMRPLLPLALMCWLLSAQLAAATRDTFAPDRTLLATPVTPMATAVNLTRQQFVQATWALQDVTCAGVFSTAKDKNFNNTLAKAVEQDFKEALVAAGWPGAAAVVRAVRQPCRDITHQDRSYASFRVGVRFNSTNTTQVRDEMWNGVGSPGIAKPCSGGYNTILYKNVAALFAKHKFTVSQNNGTRTNMFFRGGQTWLEYAAPCVPRPRPSPSPSPVPIPKAPVVNVPVVSTSCDPAAVQALADGLKAQITNGMDPAKAALVYVEVTNCKPASTSRAGRGLLQNNTTTVTLSITVSPLVQTPAQIEEATRAVYQAVTGNPAESLPAGASLDTVLQIMNTDLKQGDAQELLKKVQDAIVQQNLTSVFDATLTNTTAITGASQAIKCPSLPPAITNASWGTQCLNQDPGFVCIASCSTGGTVSATCSTAGTWTIATGTACPTAQQPTRPCTGVPPTTPEGATWPSGGCSNQTQCSATCTGAATGAPFSVCDTATGTWSAPTGSCTPIRCIGVPLVNVANANWLTNCAITVGSTCTAKCIGSGTATTATCTRVGTTTDANWAITTTGSCAAEYPSGATCTDIDGPATAAQTSVVCGAGFTAKDGASGISIAGLNEGAAKSTCCNAIYAASATCASDWKAACTGGTTLNPSGAINGLVVDSAAARAVCCSTPASPVPSPSVPNPSPGPASPSPTPGGTSPSPAPRPSPSPCLPQCPSTAAGVGATCGSLPDGCGGACNVTCSAPNQNLQCQNNVCVCIRTCASGSNLIAGSSCGTPTDGCGATCTRTCASGLICNAGTCCNPTCTGNVLVARNQTCGVPLDDSCGGSCPRVCNTTVDECNGNICRCKASCNSTANLQVNSTCGLTPNGCGGQCNNTCASGLFCTAGKCCQPSCLGNTTVAINATCGPKSDGCGNNCTNAFNVCGGNDECENGVCTCKPEKTCNNTINVAAGNSCAPVSNGCGGQCTKTCSANLFCNSGTCCQPNCPGNTTVATNATCGPKSDGCGNNCTAAFNNCGGNDECENGKCTCKPEKTCTNTNNVAAGGSCAPVSNGCGGQCTRSCSANLFCTGGTCCQPNCPGNSTVATNATCGPKSDGCGNNCTTAFNNCGGNDECENGVCTCKPEKTCTNTINVAVGASCAPVSNGCGGQCTKSCTSTASCVAGVCVAKQSSFTVTSIDAVTQTPAGNRWYQFQNVPAGNICGQIVRLDVNQESTASGATPSITSALHTPPPTYEGSTLTHALKFQTVASGVQCTIQILYPGTEPTNSEDKMGMFNGMKWKDFITQGGSIEYRWFRGSGATNDDGAVSANLRVLLVDPTTVQGQAVGVGATFVLEPRLQSTDITRTTPSTMNVDGCCITPVKNTWETDTLKYSIGGTWARANANLTVDLNPSNRDACPLYPTVEWFMSTPPRRDANGNAITGVCGSSLMWDSGPYAGFMDRAVILGLNVQQGSGAVNVVGYVGAVRIKTGDGAWDYTWKFGAQTQRRAGGKRL